MPDDQVAVVDTEDNVNNPSASSEDKVKSLQKQLTNLQKALDSERLGRKQANDQLDKAKTAELAEKGKFEELYKVEKQEKEKLSKEVEAYNDYLSSTLEDVKKTARKEVVELIPESLSPREQISWIRKAESKFKQGVSSERIGDSRGILNPGDDKTRVTITEEEYASMPREQRLKHLEQAKAIMKEDHRKRYSGSS